MPLEAPRVKERKLAGWGLSRGKAWKGSLNVTKKKKKNAPQMEANTAIMEDAPMMKLDQALGIKATQME